MQKAKSSLWPVILSTVFLAFVHERHLTKPIKVGVLFNDPLNLFSFFCDLLQIDF